MTSEIEFFLFHSSLVCTRCNETLMSRRDCSRCKKHFCYPCTDHNVRIWSKSQSVLFYVCDSCYSLLLLIEELKQTEMISWNTVSPRGRQWLLASECSTELCMSDFVGGPVPQQDLDMIGKDIYSGRTSPNTFNWEISELLARMPVSTFQENVANVLKAFCVYRPDLGYCQGMNMVVVWMLMFLDEESTFRLFVHLIENVLPKGFYSDAKATAGLSSFFVESTVVAAIAEHKITALRNSDMTVNDFVDIFAIKLFIQLFVNALDVRSTIYIWDHLMEEGSICLTRATLSVLVLCEKAIIMREHPAKILSEVEENRLGPQLQIVYGEVSVYVTKKRVDRLRSHAKTIRAKQWRESKPIILKRLEQSSNFTLAEIQRLQNEFNIVLRARFEARRSSGWKRLKKVQMHSFHGVDAATLDKMASFNEDLEPGFSREEFISMIRVYRPYLLEMADRLFELFDEDQSGSLDFKELIHFLSIALKGSFEEKLKLIFKIFTVKEAGVLTASEFTYLMSKVMKLYRLGLDFGTVPSDKIVEHVDLQTLHVLKAEWTSQKAEWEQFANFVTRDEIVMTCFVQYFEHVLSQDVASPATMIQIVGAGVEKNVSPYKEEDLSPILPEDPDEATAKCEIC